MKKYFIIIQIIILTFISSQLIAQNSDHTAQIIINNDQGKYEISKEIYGQFSEHLGHCIYGGIWVGVDSKIPNTDGIRNDVIDALKKLHVPVLRWPGGCFADEYHWMDGIGPRSERPKMVNTNWGGVVEDNSFGTHEFMEFCDLIGAEPYISGNLGSGTVEEMSKWVQYITSDGDNPMANLRRKNGREKPWKLKYWGVGNENWGCGGNMTPEYYSDMYKRFATYLKNYDGNRLYRIACGSYGENYDWTDVVMNKVGNRMQGLSLHYYSVKDWQNKGSATQFGDSLYTDILNTSLQIEKLITRNSTIMDKYDPEKKIGLMVDEWGTWYDVEPGTNPSFLYQQNTLRDAMVAAMTLNIFNNHCDRVRMANIAQMVNVLQAMILTDNDKIVLTPTYHVFEMYNVHQDAIMLPLDLKCGNYTNGGMKIPEISASASQDKSGKIHITLANIDPHNSVNISCKLRNGDFSKISGRILTAESITSHNTFENPETVNPEKFTGASLKEDMVNIYMPAKSIIVLEID